MQHQFGYPNQHPIYFMHYVEPETLAHWLLEHPERVFVVDLRDRDYCDGRIRGSAHVPFCGLRPDALLDAVPPGATDVVLHCHYSQMRGPTAARALLKAMEARGGRWAAQGKTGSPAPDGPEGLYVPGGADAPPFRVSVLRGGFAAWRDAFHANPVLYETLSGRLSSD